jgi:hypothetical protein
MPILGYLSDFPLITENMGLSSSVMSLSNGQNCNIRSILDTATHKLMPSNS